MSNKKVENNVEEASKEDVKKVEETAVEETAVAETTENEVITSTGENAEEMKGKSVESLSNVEENKEVTEEPKVETEKNEKSEKKVSNKKSENKKVKLKILIAFTDKYNSKVEYKENDIIEFEEARANELLSDTRRLVKKAD